MASKTVDTVVESNVARLRQRSEQGIDTYSTTLDRQDLTVREWLEHALDELLDGANYLTRTLRTLGSDGFHVRPSELIGHDGYEVVGPDGRVWSRGTDHTSTKAIRNRYQSAFEMGVLAGRQKQAAEQPDQPQPEEPDHAKD